MSPEVRAIGDRTDNAQLMVDVSALGWITKADVVLDPTFGLGRFWKLTMPPNLIKSDLHPKRPDVECWDFTALPLADHSVDVTVFDPPYRLAGTANQGGPASSDPDYGIGSYMDWQDRHDLIRRGITECARVTRRVLMVKCMDQVCSGEVRWQTREFADHAESCGFRLADMLHVQGYRKQPEGRRQIHARRDYSTLLILVREDASNQTVLDLTLDTIQATGL